MNYMEQSHFDTVTEFLMTLNSFRLAYKKKWIAFDGTVATLNVQVKSYDTGYLQIFRINGIDQAAPMDMKPNAWKAFIENALRKALEQG
jgi:hypothetical protein